MLTVFVSDSQRESTATIKAAPAAYEMTEPPKQHKIFEFDCRGLEFTEFKPEVSALKLEGSYYSHVMLSLTLLYRAIGWLMALTLALSSRALTWQTENGTTTTRRQARR